MSHQDLLKGANPKIRRKRVPLVICYVKDRVKDEGTRLARNLINYSSRLGLPLGYILTIRLFYPLLPFLIVFYSVSEAFIGKKKKVYLLTQKLQHSILVVLSVLYLQPKMPQYLSQRDIKTFFLNNV